MIISLDGDTEDAHWRFGRGGAEDTEVPPVRTEAGSWLQKPAFMAVPALLPLGLMLYWLWRIRVRKSRAGLVLRQV